MRPLLKTIAVFLALASMFAIGGCDSDFGVRTPTDDEVSGYFRQNTDCFRQMATKALAERKWRYVEYGRFGWAPQFHQPGERLADMPPDEVEFWSRCMRAGYVKDVFPSSVTWSLTSNDGIERKPKPGDDIVWFKIFGGGLAVGASERKGIVFVSGDYRLLSEIGSIEASTDRYNWSLPNPARLKSNRTIFRRIDDHWFVYYEVDN